MLVQGVFYIETHSVFVMVGQFSMLAHSVHVALPLVDHAMTCHRGGIPTLRHNEVCNPTAEFLAETAPGVSTEPRLQPLHDEVFQRRSANREDEARLDVRTSNFWCKGLEAFPDIRVFYSIAPFYHQKDLSSLYWMHELEKKREYSERVQEVEHGAFTPSKFCVH